MFKFGLKSTLPKPAYTLNHRKEVLVPAKVNNGIITDLKQGVGASVFPAYALDKQVTEKVCKLVKSSLKSP